VITTHRNELHNIYKNTQILHISPDDRVSLLRSHNVGAARDLLLALLNGATLCSLDLKRHDLRGIAGWLIDEGITVFTCVTTIYRQALQNAHTSMHFPDIRLVHVGGEPVTRDDVELYKKYFSDPCLFVVRYSISETPAVSYYFIDKHTPVAEGQVPVGYPMRGNEIIILDDEGNPLPPNEVGEIAIKSPFLAPGYWRQPELTKAKFLADGTGGDARTYLTGDLGYLKPDGCLIHLGRKDFLVKVRGFRVETGEVESALRGLDKVKDAAVIASLDSNAETQLTAYVVPKDQFLLTPTALRRLLREKLPDYMIPQIFVLVNALPLTANGKIDRKALPDPGNARPQIETDYMAPRTEMEKRLAQIWAEALDLSTVGVEDDFVELGGHSLLATRIIGKVHEAFGVEVSMRAFLDAASVAGLATLVSALCDSRDKIKIRNPAAAGDEEISEI
jgi:acyl-coenzyme A synthetase/AMP-(fatty) acid ligase/acyl carrier protein